MNLSVLHERLLRDVLEVGNALPFVITGGYAVQAHGLVDRLSRDIDVATDSFDPMEAIADTLVDGLTARGWRVRVIGVDSRSARFMVTDVALDEDCEVDILKEAFERPPTDTPWGPVLPLDAVIGTKVRALADRGLARDLIDVHAASKLRSNWELESLGKRYSWEEFDLENLTIRLAGAQWRADEEFTAYGLTEQELANLRSWAQGWSDEIMHRRNEELVEDYDDDQA